MVWRDADQRLGWTQYLEARIGGIAEPGLWVPRDHQAGRDVWAGLLGEECRDRQMRQHAAGDLARLHRRVGNELRRDWRRDSVEQSRLDVLALDIQRGRHPVEVDQQVAEGWHIVALDSIYTHREPAVGQREQC